MHILRHLIPWNDKARSVCTEHRSGRIHQIMLGIVIVCCDHFLCIMTFDITAKTADQISKSSCIGNHFFLIASHRGNRSPAFDARHIVLNHRLFKTAAHILKIRHRSSDILHRDLQTKFITRLQQNALCLLQALAHGTVSCLTEISALRMFLMCPSGDQCDLDICDRRTGQHTDMLFFFQMRKDQPLPVPIQKILTAVGIKLNTASPLQRLQKQMHLRIVTQRFKMSDAFHRTCDRLFIDNAALTKRNVLLKPLFDQTLQNLNLHISHQLCMDLRALFFPYNMKLRFFLLQLTQFAKHLMGITLRRQFNFIGKYRLQQWDRAFFFYAQTFARKRMLQPGDRTDCPCLCLLHHLITCPGINTDLIDLFFPGLRLSSIVTFTLQQHLDFQNAAAHFEISQAISLCIPCNLENSGCKLIPIFSFCRVSFHTFQKFVHTFLFQCRAKIAWKYFSLCDHFYNICFFYFSRFQIIFQKLFFTQSQILQKCIVPLPAEIKTGSAQFFLKIIKKTLLFFLLFLFIAFELIHFVDKQKHRDLITLQQSPECPGMSLHTVRPVDHKYSIIKHLKRPLHLRRKINMAWRIQKRHPHISDPEHRLLGKNRNAPFLFQFIIVEKCILFINSSCLFKNTALVQHSFRKRRLSCIHMCQNPKRNLFF